MALACGRRALGAPWQGMAMTVAAERLQLVLGSSLAAQLQPSSLSAADKAGQQRAWHAAAAAWGAPCPTAGACGWARPARVRWHSTQPQPPADGGVQKPASGSIIEAFTRAGWTRREVLNVPNGLSMLRLLSGPVIAAWIVQGQWHLALPTLAVSGATDWADGYVAKNYNQRSVLGSYLDPLADKTLMCSVIAAMGYTGALSPGMVTLILGRDVFLVAGAFAARAKMLGWRWPGAGEFFRLQSGSAGGGSGECSRAGAAPSPGAQQEPAEQQQQQQQQQQPAATGGAAGGEAPAAPFVEPLYISKVNTCFQLGLAGVCMARAWLGWPGEDAVWWAAAGTAGTTVWSCAAYVRAYAAGNLLTAGHREGKPAGGV